jgi:hypothetical protein
MYQLGSVERAAFVYNRNYGMYELTVSSKLVSKSIIAQFFVPGTSSLRPERFWGYGIITRVTYLSKCAGSLSHSSSVYRSLCFSQTNPRKRGMLLSDVPLLT